MGLDRQNGAAAGKSPPLWIYGLLEGSETFALGHRAGGEHGWCIIERWRKSRAFLILLAAVTGPLLQGSWESAVFRGGR
jgi:hypothetical protein